MCTISGLYFCEYDLNKFDNYVAKFQMLVKNGKERGRDSIGISVQYRDGTRAIFKSMNINQFDNTEEIFNKEIYSIIINHRAEPLTEYKKVKTEFDIQPFAVENFAIVHNGTIANDVELTEKYNLDRMTKTDSEVIALMLERDQSLTGLTYLKGSYAIAIQDKSWPKRLALACNYQPIYLCFDNKLDCYYFASSDTFFGDTSDLRRYSVCKIKPYSIYNIFDDHISTVNMKPSLYDKQKKALVVCSGGLDSTVAATIAKQKYKKIKLIHFCYGCHAEDSEVEAVMKIADELDCEYQFIDTDIFTKYATGSRLTTDGATIASQIEGSELAKEWVYCRNLIFLSMAAGYAEAHGYDVLVLGNNLEEAESFSDNTQEFIRRFNDILPNSLNLNNHLEIVEPVGNLMKKEIVDLGLRIGAPLHLTWSCYHNGDEHCGECSPCGLRKMAFHVLHKKEVITYKSDRLMGDD